MPNGGLGRYQALLFDPTIEQPQFRYYPNGLADADTCDVRHVENRSVTLSAIFDDIDRVHDRFLRTGAASSRSVKLWQNKAKHRPKREIEDLVQFHLRLGLTIAFPLCIVREELNSPAGRCDLKIEDREPEPSTGGIVPHAILELKIVKSYGSKGNSYSALQNSRWIASGVTQAESYRIEWSARAAALCCFDMRVKPEGDAMFTDSTREDARQRGVELRAWSLYPTPERERAASRAQAGARD